MDFNLLYDKLIERTMNHASDKDLYGGSILRQLSNTPSTITLTKKAEAMDEILDRGLTYGEPGEQGVFVIASRETYLKAAEAGVRGDYSAFGSVETLLPILEVVGSSPTRINTGFTMAINNLLEIHPNESLILDKGIVEVGDFTVLQSLIDEGFGSVFEALDRILDKGIVLSRIDGIVTIASVETFLKLVEAMGIGGVPA